jgi:hypothetical protein
MSPEELKSWMLFQEGLEASLGAWNSLNMKI